MLNFRKHKIIHNNMRIHDEYHELIVLKNKVKPNITALKIFALYTFIGGAWILLSDKVLDLIVQSEVVFKKIQLYKGWLYVFVTGFIFFLIVRRVLKLYKSAMDDIMKAYEELNATYEELMAMNEELDQQNHELEFQKNALSRSEQRYQIVAEGSYDGIWDWDIVDGNYYLSNKWKIELGYKNGELDNSIQSWSKLFYPGDWKKNKRAIDKYLDEKQGIFEYSYRVRNKAGEYRWIQSRGKGVWDENGKPIRIAGSHTDITERKLMEDKLESLAFYDTLTGIPNRLLFEQKVKNLINNKQKFTIINMDLDDIKHINDMYGLSAGDKCIKYVANILLSMMPEPDIIARVSGDQFVIAHIIDEEKNDTSIILEKLFEHIRDPLDIDENNVFISASAGYAEFPEHGSEYYSLIQNAEIAMFHQKNHGKNGFTLFIPSMYQDTLKIIEMNAELRKAIENNEFVLYYQPQYDIHSGNIIGVESLIRWNHPNKGFIPPMEFIPLSEKTGHIIPITLWVIRTAFNQKKEWEKKGLLSVKVAINMSGYAISDEKSICLLCELIEELNIKPGEIEIEVTETALMLDMDKAKQTLEKLRSYGISIAMDDFGTGYSSLTYLHTLPFDIIKMDREFIKNIKNEDEENYIYKTLINLSHNMNLKIVAEGIETKEQRDFLQKNQCDVGQGYYYSRPLPANEIEKLLKI